jgi:hypothetical protein
MLINFNFSALKYLWDSYMNKNKWTISTGKHFTHKGATQYRLAYVNHKWQQHLTNNMVLVSVTEDTGYGLYVNRTHNVIRGHYLDKVPLQGMFISAMLCYVSTTHCSLLRLIVRSWLDIPTFATRCLHECHHARAPSGGKWNCGREMSGNFA